MLPVSVFSGCVLPSLPSLNAGVPQGPSKAFSSHFQEKMHIYRQHFKLSFRGFLEVLEDLKLRILFPMASVPISMQVTVSLPIPYLELDT